MFKNLGEKCFDDYWMNYRKITITTDDGKSKPISKLSEYLKYRGKDPQLANPKAKKSKKKKKMKVNIPPLKCQGIKTKLVPWILANTKLTKNGLWIEPFMGSGVVGFNAYPNRAIFNDLNPHIINFYQAIKNGNISPSIARQYLEEQGSNLKKWGINIIMK